MGLIFTWGNFSRRRQKLKNAKITPRKNFHLDGFAMETSCIIVSIYSLSNGQNQLAYTPRKFYDRQYMNFDDVVYKLPKLALPFLVRSRHNKKSHLPNGHISSLEKAVKASHFPRDPRGTNISSLTTCINIPH